MDMIIHRLDHTQFVPASPADCWDFFSNPSNLEKITPPSLAFEVRSAVPPRIYAGLMIEYRVTPLFGIRLPWLTEITHVEDGKYFVDEQRMGPYAIWHHEHFFTPGPDGGTTMRDLVHYRLPLSPFSEVIHPVLVAPQLAEIFAFRRVEIEKRFGGSKPE